MHTLTLSFDSTDELMKFMERAANPPIPVNSIYSSPPSPPPVERDSNVVAIGSRTAKKAKPEKQPAPTTDLSAEEKPEPNAEPVEAGKTLDYKTDVRPTALKLIKHPDGNGQVRMSKIFDDFGVTNATELTAEQLPAYLAAVQTELGE